MRAKSFFRAVIFLGGAMLLLPASAEEKNGLMVNVSKKTLGRVDNGPSAQIGKTQALGVVVKNTSIKDLPEGEVKWTILVLKADSTTPYKYIGREPLKALRPSASAELVLGAAQTTGYRASYYGNYRDKLEYEITINHAGKESFRTSSDKNFALLAKDAILATPEDTVAPTVAIDPAGGVTLKPADAKPLVPMTPMTPPSPPAPVTPATPVAPANPNPPPPPETPAGQPFDFFNLDRKK
jgi:hypothetical protein